MSEAGRAQQLYDEGARLLAAAWDDAAGLVAQTTPRGAVHPSRAAIAYAHVLLRDGGAANVERASGILRTVATLQETRERDAHYGNFKWYAEDAGVTDLNAVEFALDGLNALYRDHAADLPPDVRDLVRRMIAIGLHEIARLDVHLSYTNIALSDIANAVLGGENIGDDDAVARGARRLDDWLDFTARSGAPHEYNSPTYLAVDLNRLAALAAGTRDPAVAIKARIAEERVWLHLASRYHPPLAQLAGPYARSYRDGWTGAPGYLKLALWRLLGDDNLRRPTPWFASREEGHTGVALARYDCPPHALDWLRQKRYPFLAQEMTDAAAGSDITSYLAEDFALGTSSRSYAVGDPPEPSLQFSSMLLHFRNDAPPGFGTMFCRYVIDDRAPPATVADPDRDPHDFWDDGRHVAVQHRNRAIVAYGLRARARPVRSLKLSVRLLDDPSREVYAGGRCIDALPAPVAPGEPLVIVTGDVFIAIIPLVPTDMGSDAPLELVDDRGMLALDIYNYAGPPKTFWEYASLGGAFYKGNVRSAFVVEVASRRDFGDVHAFRRHLASASVRDSVDRDNVRDIAYASEGGSLAMRYSLRDMSLIERRCDGATYAPPMARAGAVDGGGAQWVQSRGQAIEVAGARLAAGGAPAWLVADPERRRYAAANPAPLGTIPLRLATPAVGVECDAFHCGRLSLDEREHALRIEAVERPAGLRLRSDAALRFSFNGADVTRALTPAGDVWEWLP